MNCQNCGSENNPDLDNCICCDYPLVGNADEKVKSYKSKVSGININYKYLSTHYMNTILVLAVLFLIATISILSYKIINNDRNFFPLLILGFISAFYLLMYSLGKKSRDFLYLSRFALLFYIVHSAIEVSTNIYPKNLPAIHEISMKMSLYSSIEMFLPYFYFAVRIAVLYFFVRGLLTAIKLHREKKALEYYLTMETYKNGNN